MAARQLAVAFAVALLAAGAASAEESGGEGPGLSVCGLAQETCTAVADAYRAALELAGNDRPGEGLLAAVTNLAELDPNVDAAYSFQRAIGDAVASIPSEPPATGAPGAPPADSAMPTLVLLDAGALLVGPDAAAVAVEAYRGAGADALLAEGRAAADGLPADPRAEVGAVLADLQGIALAPWFGRDAKAAPPETASVAAVVLEEARGSPPDVLAPPAALGWHEALDLDPVRAAPLPATADERGAPLLPTAVLEGATATLAAGPGRAAVLAAITMLGAALLLPPLYHRLQQHKLLDHGTRARLYRLVVERPGIHIEELARLAACSRSTAVYHLRLLARHGYVAAMGARKSVHYYANTGGVHPDERERRALLASPRTRSVAARIAAQPGIGRAALAAQEGISVSTLSWHLGRLLRLGLVEDRLTADGRALHPAEGLEGMLRPWTLPSADGPGDAPEAAPAAMDASRTPA